VWDSCFVPAQAKSSGEHCPVVHQLDRSKIAAPEYLCSQEILSVPDLAILCCGYCGRRHQVQSRGALPDSRNQGSKDRRDVAVGISSFGSADCEDVAIRFAPAASRFFVGGWRDSLRRGNRLVYQGKRAILFSRRPSRRSASPFAKGED